MKRSYGVHHCVVECETCGWRSESYKNGQAIAAKHAKKYFHKVSGDLGISFTYDNQDESSEGRKGT